jgi:ParB family chromosome partitioning protein
MVGGMTEQFASTIPTTTVQSIRIDSIYVLNPRVRNVQKFDDMVQNIAKVGLKRPITVTPSQNKPEGKEYDLVCGQGRLEAFIACGQTTIPAMVIDASEDKH